MTQGFVGADVVGLRSLAQQFEREAQTLTSAAMTVTRGVQAQFWAGPIALRFEVSWTQQHLASLGSATESLRAAADALRRNANQQDTASRADGAPPSWTGGGTGSSNGERDSDSSSAKDKLETAIMATDSLGNVFDLIENAKGKGIFAAASFLLNFVNVKEHPSLEAAGNLLASGLDVITIAALWAQGASSLLAKVAGPAASGIGVLIDLVKVVGDVKSGDVGSAAFDIVHGGLLAASGVALATGVGAPVAIAFAAAAVGMDFTKMIWENTPALRSAVDATFTAIGDAGKAAGGWAVDRIVDVKNGVTKAVNWAGEKVDGLVKGAQNFTKGFVNFFTGK